MKKLDGSTPESMKEATVALMAQGLPPVPMMLKAFFVGAGTQFAEAVKPTPQPEGNDNLYPDNVWAAADRLAMKVAPIYKMLNWKWAGENAVPEVRHIREALLKCWADLQSDAEADMVEYCGVYCEEIGEGVYQFGFELTEVIEEA